PPYLELMKEVMEFSPLKGRTILKFTDIFIVVEAKRWRNRMHFIKVLTIDGRTYYALSDIPESIHIHTPTRGYFLVKASSVRSAFCLIFLEGLEAEEMGQFKSCLDLEMYFEVFFVSDPTKGGKRSIGIRRPGSKNGFFVLSAKSFDVEKGKTYFMKISMTAVPDNRYYMWWLNDVKVSDDEGSSDEDLGLDDIEI
ncbi:MAG: hypothetical protein C0180_00350, partial [Aciduliprofundum sp.]